MNMYAGWAGRAGKTYVHWTLGSMAVVAAINVAAMFGVFDPIEGTPLAWAIAAAVAIAICVQIWAILVYMRDSDEFVRAVTAKQFILAAGIAVAAFSGWGFAESYADAPHAPGFIVYPLFWFAFGLVSAFVRTSRA